MVAASTGVLSPGLFRELERIEPYRSIAPWALSLPWVRRRLYAAYIRRVYDDLVQARKHANREVYSLVPIQEIDARHGALDPDGAPAERLLTRLTASEEEARAHVLIESPGGRGKSALLRETVCTALDAFQKDSKRPLPIICVGDGEDLFDRAMRTLGTEGFSEELIRSLMRSGEFFLVVDGLTESTITPHMIQTHAAQYDVKCPMLLAGRPNEQYRRAFEATSAWAVVEPLRLDETTLVSFIRAYGGEPECFSAPILRR